MREIDITKEPINCIDELIIDEEKRSIEATYELWIDDPVDITALMILDGDDSCEEKEWELTQEEKEFFCKMMEDYCMQKDGCTLRELFEKYGHSTSEI